MDFTQNVNNGAFFAWLWGNGTSLNECPANTRHRCNVGPMLGHRLRRWPNMGNDSCLLWYVWGLTSPSGWNRFQPQIDPAQNRGTFLWTVIGLYRISNISVSCPHAQLTARTGIKKLWTFFGPWGRDRSQPPPYWIFRVKQIHQSTASERTTRLGSDIIREAPPPRHVYCEHALSGSTVRGSLAGGSMTGGPDWITTENKQKILVKSQPVAITGCK